MRTRPIAIAATLAATLAAAAALSAARPAPAHASLLKNLCQLAGVGTPFHLNPCSAAHHIIGALRTGSELASGNFAGVAQSVASGTASIALGAVASWATAGARFALDETAHLIAATTSPRLAAPWFTLVYWRFAGVAILLTLPFLFAAALQALIRSDLSLLIRSAFGYLPLAMLGVGVAAQLTGLLLAATDELCAAVSGVAGDPAPAFLARAGTYVAGLSAASGSPFLAVLVAAFTVAGAIVLWLELVLRGAAVYVIVVMLPLAFAALVWPARRVWALRATELLVALILSKLAMVAVLTLGAAALEQDHTAAAFLTGLTLLILGAFAPWVMLRFVPFAELAAGAAGRLRSEMNAASGTGHISQAVAFSAHEWASDLTARLRRDAQGEAAGHAPASTQLRNMQTDAAEADAAPAPQTHAAGADTSPASEMAGAGAGAPDLPHPEPEAAVEGSESFGVADGEDRHFALLPDEVGPRGERRPGMPARWQAQNGGWQPLNLGIEDGWSPVTWPEQDQPPGPDEPPEPEWALEPGGIEPGGIEPGGIEPGGIEPGGIGRGGIEP